MGYTHYYKTSAIVQPDWDALIEDAKRIVANSGVPVQFECDVDQPAVLSENEIRFNGVGDAGYETFLLSRVNVRSSFCKTAHRPYDAVVTAILVAAKARLGDRIEISSDGGDEDWADGFELADRLLGYTAKFNEDGHLEVN